MSDPGQCRQIRSALGVYLLGAIGPAERFSVDRHLAGCTDCREELAGLASLVGRLGTVPAADVVRLAADTEDGPAGPGRAMVARACCCTGRPGCAAAGCGAGWRRPPPLRRWPWARRWPGLPALLPPAPQPVAVVWPETVSGSNPMSGAGAIVRYRARPWGVQIVVQVSRIPAGTRCELRVVTAAGQQATAASWTVAAYRNGVWYPASAPFPEDGVRDFIVVSAGRTLVSVRAR